MQQQENCGGAGGLGLATSIIGVERVLIHFMVRYDSRIGCGVLDRVFFLC